MKEAPILYINIPWMERYQGASDDDMPYGKFKYTRDEPLNDHTQFNFKPYGTKYFGHAPGGKNPDLSRLGAGLDAMYLDGVTVIWFATHRYLGGRVIVGWSNGARVWAKRQKPEGSPAKNRTTNSGDVCEFTVESLVASSKLLAPGERPALPISGNTRQGKPGQSPFWYGNELTNERVLKVIKAGEFSSRQAKSRKGAFSAGRGGWIQDTKERMEIEKRAMECVMEAYRHRGYLVEDVSLKKIGYDVRATSVSGRQLHIEVKGSKGDRINIELTPNEYAYSKKNRDKFILCVVLKALTARPRTLILIPAPRGLSWYDQSGNTVQAVERVGVVISER
ncbi:MAG: DUF3883 domain-containing protein [bacterium]|nr:DUF3883 domain-containing protein [bacterium]